MGAVAESIKPVKALKRVLRDFLPTDHAGRRKHKACEGIETTFRNRNENLCVLCRRKHKACEGIETICAISFLSILASVAESIKSVKALKRHRPLWRPWVLLVRVAESIKPVKALKRGLLISLELLQGLSRRKHKACEGIETLASYSPAVGS